MGRSGASRAAVPHHQTLSNILRGAGAAAQRSRSFVFTCEFFFLIAILPPAFSLRTLSRALEYARAAMPVYGMQRALLDGLSMARTFPFTPPLILFCFIQSFPPHTHTLSDVPDAAVLRHRAAAGGAAVAPRAARRPRVRAAARPAAAARTARVARAVRALLAGGGAGGAAGRRGARRLRARPLSAATPRHPRPRRAAPPPPHSAPGAWAADVLCASRAASGARLAPFPSAVKKHIIPRTDEARRFTTAAC